MKQIVYGKPATGENFLGRKREVKELLFDVNEGISTVLIAPRRFGKTSLLLEIEKRSKLPFIHIDLMKIYNKRNLAEKMIDETYRVFGIVGFVEKSKNIGFDFLKSVMQKLTSIKASSEDFELDLAGELLASSDDNRLLQFAFELPNKLATKTEQKILICFDELGEIDKLQKNDDILKLMRATFQHSDNIVFMFAGSQFTLMHSIFMDESSPFFRFAKRYDVKPMRLEGYEEALKSFFKDKGIKSYAELIPDIHMFSDGVPYYIMALAHALYRDAMLEDKKIESFSLFRAYHDVYEAEKYHFLNELNKVKGRKYLVAILRSIANDENPYDAIKKVASGNMRKYLKELESMGFIIQKDKKYKIVDKLFKRFLLNEI